MTQAEGEAAAAKAEAAAAAVAYGEDAPAAVRAAKEGGGAAATQAGGGRCGVRRGASGRWWRARRRGGARGCGASRAMRAVAAHTRRAAEMGRWAEAVSGVADAGDQPVGRLMWRRWRSGSSRVRSPPSRQRVSPAPSLAGDEDGASLEVVATSASASIAGSSRAVTAAAITAPGGTAAVTAGGGTAVVAAAATGASPLPAWRCSKRRRPLRSDHLTRTRSPLSTMRDGQDRPMVGGGVVCALHGSDGRPLGVLLTSAPAQLARMVADVLPEAMEAAWERGEALRAGRYDAPVGGHCRRGRRRGD